MSVIFNSVNQFVEAVGRRTVQEKPNSLDQLECIFTGPSALAIGFLPKPKSRHPVYPMMYCSRSEILAKEALVAEVRVSYVGKLSGAPNGVYITTPDVSRSRHLGSVSFTTTVSLSPILLATTSYTVRYIAKAATFKYLTNQAPAANFAGNFVAAAAPLLGSTNVQSFRTSLAYATGAPSSGYMQASMVFEGDLVSVDVDDLDNGWFQVSEQYLTQALVNTEVIGTPGASGTAGNKLNPIDFSIPPA
jgi:hypothetical protein